MPQLGKHCIYFGPKLKTIPTLPYSL